MALSPSEKQRAYRERQRVKLASISNVTEAEMRAKEIVDSLAISSMDVDLRSYFFGLLIGSLCPGLKIQYVLAGLNDSLSNVTDCQGGGVNEY